MKNTKTQTVSLAFSDIARGGTSDKVYHLALEGNGKGFNVTAQYGRRGSALAVDNKTKNGSVSYDEARQIFDRVLREKKAKGYVEAGPASEAGPAAQVQPPSNGAFHHEPKRQELLEEIRSEADLDRFIESDEYWMQDKSDGHSRGAVKTADGQIYGLNKLGNSVPLPAEIVSELARVQLERFQVDAELVGDKLVCRDLLVADADISLLPYCERFVTLVSFFSCLKHVAIVETWEGRENKMSALWQQRKDRREGVVLKLKNAPHRGGRNGQHKKFKFVKTCSVIAGEPRASGKDSVTIHLFDEIGKRGEGIRRVGTVSLIGKEKVHAGDVLEVCYLYAFPSKMLCQARLMRIRADVTAEECTTAQLVFKREEQS